MNKCFRCGKTIEDGYTICHECSEKTKKDLLRIAIVNFAQDHELTMDELLEEVKAIQEGESDEIDNQHIR